MYKECLLGGQEGPPFSYLKPQDLGPAGVSIQTLLFCHASADASLVALTLLVERAHGIGRRSWNYHYLCQCGRKSINMSEELAVSLLWHLLMPAIMNTCVDGDLLYPDTMLRRRSPVCSTEAPKGCGLIDRFPGLLAVLAICQISKTAPETHGIGIPALEFQLTQKAIPSQLDDCRKATSPCKELGPSSQVPPANQSAANTDLRQRPNLGQPSPSRFSYRHASLGQVLSQL